MNDNTDLPGSSQLTLNFPVQEEWNFESFICESANQELLCALQKLNGTDGGPLFIWGEQGSGKTHLLQALCQRTENSMYLPVSEILGFGTEVLEGLERLRLICLDDIHLFAGREEWQSAFFALFNRVREYGNLLVLSAGCPLSRLNFELADLTSRIQWGPVYQVHVLSDEGKTRLLAEAGDRRGIRLTDDLVSYILSRSERSISSLYAVLNRLDELSLVDKRRITQPYIKSIMGW